MVRMVFGEDQVFIYLCAWHILKVCKLNWLLHSIEKIDNGCHVQYWTTFTPSCTCPLNHVKTLKLSWLMGEIRSLKASPNIYLMIHGFDTWTFYFQLGTWINSQSIIVVPPCYAYPKISILWIKIKTPMIQTIPCGYCCRLVDGGALTSATFKLGHTNINWVLPRGIENLVFFENKRALKSTHWLVSVEIHNNGCKTLHAHG